MTDFKSVLRQSGFRATSGKINILSALSKVRRPVSVADLASHLRGRVDTVTLYRALEGLSDKGIVRRIDLGHAHAHYELTGAKEHHHHLVCKVCGFVEDITSCKPFELEKRVLKKSKTFASIQSHAMEFFGICKKCAV